MTHRSLTSLGPEHMEVHELDLPQPPPGQALVRTRLSALSAGSEMLAQHGHFPVDLPLDATLPDPQRPFAHPLTSGDVPVGVVETPGEGVEGAWQGRRRRPADHRCSPASRQTPGGTGPGARTPPTGPGRPGGLPSRGPHGRPRRAGQRRAGRAPTWPRRPAANRPACRGPSTCAASKATSSSDRGTAGRRPGSIWAAASTATGCG